jgi:hypothetical protein
MFPEWNIYLQLHRSILSVLTEHVYGSPGQVEIDSMEPREQCCSGKLT